MILKKVNIFIKFLIITLLITSCTTQAASDGGGGGGGNNNGSSGSLNVHFYYTGADTPNIYAWSGSTQYSGVWPGKAMTSEGNNWFYSKIPASSSNVIFNWSNASAQTSDLSRSKDGWYYKNKWFDSNPADILPDCEISTCAIYDTNNDSTTTNSFAVSSSGSYIGDSYIVKASVIGLASNFQYDTTTINTETYSGTWTEIPSDGTINIGSGMNVGNYRLLKIKATNNAGSKETEYKFSKIALPANSSEMTKLGANITSGGNTRFSIWSPDHDNVKVIIGGTEYACTRQTDLGWLNKIYYYEYSGKVSTGTEYSFIINGNKARDPYARMSTPSTNAASESSIFVDPDDVTYTFSNISDGNYYQNKTDAIIYEVHVRDFTIGTSISNKGKFGGMVETGLTNSGGKAIGIDHLKELGVTHVQLMPVYDFKTSQYNWGYDPWNYNVPEDQYSSSADPKTRMTEFKAMVDNFHKNGIRVIMDVVYNHTYNTSVFANITSSYYDGLNLSGCGNSIDTSNPMVNKFILDSLKYWIEEYNVDGFRFDLAGIFYTDVMNEWGVELNSAYPAKKLLIYGEPWNGYASDPNESKKVRPGKIPAMTSGEIGAFNSSFRETIKGNNDGNSKGWMFGVNTEIGNTTNILTGLQGSMAATTSADADNWTRSFAYHPYQTINYISAHDNFCLWDKINYSGVTSSTAKAVDKLGMGLVLTAQGIPFIHAGDEFLRTKAYNSDYATAKNTYNANDNYNKIYWDLKTTNNDIFNYYKELITLRKTYSVLRYSTHSDLNGKVTSISSDATSLVTTVKDGSSNNKLVICYNSGNSAKTFTLPDSENYKKIFNSNGNVTDATIYSGSTTGDARGITVFAKQ